MRGLVLVGVCFHDCVVVELWTDFFSVASACTIVEKLSYHLLLALLWKN